MWTTLTKGETCLDRVDDVDDSIMISEDRRHTVDRHLRTALTPALPDCAFPGLDVRAVGRLSHSRATIGSDFCDAFRLPGGATALILGEVVGNSAAAPLQIPQVKFGLRGLLVENPSPSRALTAINRWMCLERALARAIRSFGRAAIAVFDDQSDWAEIASAGSETPLILSGFGTVSPIDAAGLPIGIDADFIYESSTFRLDLGDTLVMSTNGISNARHGRDVLGYRGMTALVEAASTLADADYGVARYVMEGALAFAAGALQDNATVLTAQRVGTR